MIIKDKVYGEFEIKEQVLIDLINSKAIQRLKDISQQGVPLKYNPQPHFSRYEHSVGVMLLLRKLGANLNEQIAGLLHDMSHPTFSHLIDWIDGDPEVQGHQDNQFVKILKNSDVPKILEKYNLSVEEFFDLDKYSLLEQETPDLCADRVDYTLRDLVAHGGKTISDNLIKHLIVYENIIVFDSIFDAHAFAQEYKALQFHNWGDDRNNSMFQVFSNALKKALNKGVIQKEDFMSEESHIIDKLENSNDKNIIDLLKLLKGGFVINYDVVDGFQIKCKYRFIDPKVFESGEINKISELIPSYKYQLDLHKNHFKDKRMVGVIPR